MRSIVLLLFFLLFFQAAVRTQELGSLVVLDTLEVNGKDIIIYDNFTWQYLYTDSLLNIMSLADSLATHNYIVENKLFKEDSLTLFTTDWDSVNIFSWSNISKPFKDTIAIRLLSDSCNFSMPTLGYLQYGFGWRRREMHNGIDLKLELGDTVIAAFDGIVRYARWNKGGYGNLVIVRHFNGIETYYAHLSKILCKPNQVLKSGDIVGLGGKTGRAYGTHLHFETRFKDKAFDPQIIIDVETKRLKTNYLVLMPKNLKNHNIVQYNKSANSHIVKKGDTLWGISNMYKVSVKNICTLNGFEETATLSIGQKLRIR